MKELRKVLMVVMPNRDLKFIPVDEIKDCKIIELDDEVKGFFIFDEEIPGGSMYDPGIAPAVMWHEIGPADMKKITHNGNICYVEVDHEGKLKTPSNGRGHRQVVLFISDDLGLSDIEKHNYAQFKREIAYDLGLWDDD